MVMIFPRFVGAIMGTPADVVKARIMNQPTDKSGKGEYARVIHVRLGHSISSPWLFGSNILSLMLS